MKENRRCPAPTEALKERLTDFSTLEPDKIGQIVGSLSEKTGPKVRSALSPRRNVERCALPAP
ncbi:hypothetical protein BOSE62_80175 [Bosea sp. 62]|nr:hypothetical protein BOSE21B_20096 [Bosea sp. 21B]CAD5274427.1 hypothetical protein BOSE46_20391 [Bosea sp. 46]VXC41990.1 hypothetical protein BOSE29B_30933 [Bosea sp. 29B]VXC66510.1 hypothetical protein BOSE125_30538 [Bosea sp. 125]VXC97071.1 hypothetical protein BOSE62_80175 [Bosea sp. 62]